jgi:deoxyribodipyrimidine photolyase
MSHAYTHTVLVEALQNLRQELQQLGSNLVVVTGPWSEAIPTLVNQVSAGAVIAEEEVEHL